MMHKYKIGELVMVKSRKWYFENCDYKGEVNVKCSFVEPMRDFCGRKGEILHYTMNGYIIDFNDKGDNDWEWSDDMLESVREVRKRKLKKLNEKTY